MKRFIFQDYFPIPMYSVMILVGIICALGAFFWLCHRHHLARRERNLLLILVPIILVTGMLSAMLFDKIAHFDEAPWYQPAGISFAGGLVGGSIFFGISYAFLMAKYRQNIWVHLDIFAPCVVLAHGFGRIGCFCGGCCFGVPTDSIFGVIFPPDSIAAYLYGFGVPVLPTQLFESAFLFVLFAVLVFAMPKYRTGTYLVAYAVFRFLLEFWRGDNRGHLSDLLSPSQILCILIFVAGVVCLVICHRDLQKTPKMDLPAKTLADDEQNVV